MTAASLRIAFVHYHARRGGVTRVIEHAVRALAGQRVATVLLTGEPPAPGVSVGPWAVVPGLGYAASPVAGSATDLTADLRRAARSALGTEPDVWHFHNHALGKNPTLPGAVFELVRDGARLLLHIHDFAEDGRPENYRLLREQASPGLRGDAPVLYPVAPRVHYAVLNPRDLRLLTEAGMPEAHLHSLPNPVSVEAPTEAEPTNGSVRERLLLYPTRGIRRKNLGELLLWAAAAADGYRFAITLAPENPAARPVYDAWETFAEALRLPVQFEAGAQSGLPFGTLIRSAYALVTTSVAEGFGLAFLEPWVLGRGLVGRDLPEITSGLRQESVALPRLYEHCLVPWDWVGRQRFHDAVASGLARTRAAYGRATTAEDIKRAAAAAGDGDRVDFGRLNEPLQREVIRRVRASREACAAMQPARLEDRVPGPEIVQRNRVAIEARFNLTQYGRRLAAIYAALTVAGSGGGKAFDALPPDAVVDAFLAPEQFNLLRSVA